MSAPQKPKERERQKLQRCPKNVIRGANIKRRCLLPAGHKERCL